MKITWIGNHEEGVPAFRAVASYKTINAFITLTDSSFKKRSAGSRRYVEICKKYDIPVYYIDTIKGDRAYKIVVDACPDLLVVLGWSEILPERLLDVPRIGTVGTHASLLPHNRGSAPINWALIHGEKTTGNTLMWLNKDVDAGEIIAQREFPIGSFDTCASLYERVAETNEEMLMELIYNIENGIKPISSIKNVTNEPVLSRRRPQDGLMDWNQKAEVIYDFVRALTKPYPGAYSFLYGQQYIIWEASILPLVSNEAPGTILGTGYGFADNGTGICVSTQDNVLWITALQANDNIVYSNESLYNLQLKGRFNNE